jgi:hypothetical protein
VIISTTAKRKSEMPDFTDTPERTRATYLAVTYVHTGVILHARTLHTSLLHARTTYLQLVCEPNPYPNFLTYIQVSFFLWGFLKPILGCGIVVFGGQGSHQDISLECLQGYFHFPLLHSGEFLTSNERKTHVYRDNRRHSDNYRIVAQYHTHHHYCTTQR